jgi:hypothetical protein
MSRIIIETRYNIGDEIYSRANPELKGFIIGLNIRNNLSFHYLVSWGIEDSNEHYEFELTDEKDYINND